MGLQSCFKYLALLGGNCGVPIDEFGKDTTQRLDTQRQWSHIQKQHIGYIASQNATLDGCPNSDSFIRVHRLAGGSAKQILDCLLNLQGGCGGGC